MVNDVNGPESGWQRAVPVAFTPERGRGAGRTVRADAVRNRERVLAAAARLFRERGVAAVTMDHIAVAAGVGKGTLYRRFGDKSGLAEALLDRREAELQERILTGPPPLGPGAAPGERLRAFLDAYLELLDTDLGLLVVAETSGKAARYHSGAYAFWRAHVAGLLAGGASPIDAHVGAHLVLAGLAAELYEHLRSGEGRSRREIGGAVAALAAAVLPPVSG